jgi:hypothetical protein
MQPAVSKIPLPAAFPNNPPQLNHHTSMIKFGKKANMVEETKMEDPTAWMLENIVADFLLMPGYTIYMCMLGYTFLVGCKVFKGVPSDASVAYKFVNMLFACLGGGVLVPIFLNGIPVPLASDAYILAILCSFALHYYFPILREVVGLSKILKVSFIRCMLHALDAPYNW